MVTGTFWGQNSAFFELFSQSVHYNLPHDRYLKVGNSNQSEFLEKVLYMSKMGEIGCFWTL